VPFPLYCEENLADQTDQGPISSHTGQVTASNSGEPENSEEPSEVSGPSNANQSSEVDEPNQIEPIDREEMQLRRSSRITKTPTYLDEFVTYYSTKHPIQEHLRYDIIAPKFRYFLFAVDKVIEPSKYEEACKHEIWVKAMQEEIDVLDRNQTWQLVLLPKGKQIVGCK
jgi:hypothetical protein